MNQSGNLAPKIVAGLLLAAMLTIVFALVISAENTRKTNQSQTTNSISNSTNKTAMVYEYNPEATASLVKITTEKGSFQVELYPEYAPQTVSNFVRLISEGYYNGLTFHRYEPGFVIQGGDPEGTGMGGPGYTVPAEFTPYLQHEKGALAMARQGDAVNPEKASSGSQFYITLDAAHFLDGEYTVFGKVVEGMNIVEQLRRGDTMQLEIIK